MTDSRAHALISGIVQGVSFRYYTYHEALRIGLQGWVRNLQDGRVEAVFEGEKEQIDAVLAWIQQGPPAAKVEDVNVSWEEPQGGVDGFEVRPTGVLSP